MPGFIEIDLSIGANSSAPIQGADEFAIVRSGVQPVKCIAFEIKSFVICNLRFVIEEKALDQISSNDKSKITNGK
jgi:hypothetical protein